MDNNRINLELLHDYYDSFHFERTRFNNITCATFNSSYFKNCSDENIRKMNSKLENCYQNIKKEYDIIINWWKNYNDDVGSVENGISMESVQISAHDSSISSYYGTHLSPLPKCDKNELVISLNIGEVSPSTTYNSTVISAGLSQGLNKKTVGNKSQLNVNKSKFGTKIYTQEELKVKTSNDYQKAPTEIRKMLENTEYKNLDEETLNKIIPTYVLYLRYENRLKKEGYTIRELVQDAVNQEYRGQSSFEMAQEFLSSLNLSASQWAGKIVGETSATGATMVLGMVEGVVNVGENIVDATMMAGAFVSDAKTWAGSTLLGKDVEFGTTMNQVKDIVQFDASKTTFDSLYENTQLGNSIAENTNNFEAIRQVSNQIGEVGAVVTLSAVTPFSAPVIAGVSGLGAGMEKAYNDGATTSEGFVYGIANGAANAAAYAIGGKINNFNPFSNTLANSATHVALDSVDAFVESFISPATSLIYEKGYTDSNGEYHEYTGSFTEKYTHSFEAQGGWSSVIEQTMLSGGMSAISEAGGVAKYFRDKNKVNNNNLKNIQTDTDINIKNNVNSDAVKPDYDKIKSKIDRYNELKKIKESDEYLTYVDNVKKGYAQKLKSENYIENIETEFKQLQDELKSLNIENLSNNIKNNTDELINKTDLYTNKKEVDMPNFSSKLNGIDKEIYNANYYTKQGKSYEFKIQDGDKVPTNLWKSFENPELVTIEYNGIKFTKDALNGELRIKKENINNVDFEILSRLTNYQETIINVDGYRYNLANYSSNAKNLSKKILMDIDNVDSDLQIKILHANTLNRLNNTGELTRSLVIDFQSVNDIPPNLYKYLDSRDSVIIKVRNTTVRASNFDTVESLTKYIIEGCFSDLDDIIYELDTWGKEHGASNYGYQALRQYADTGSIYFNGKKYITSQNGIDKYISSLSAGEVAKYLDNITLKSSNADNLRKFFVSTGSSSHGTYGVNQGCIKQLCNYELNGRQYSYKQSKEIVNSYMEKGLPLPKFKKTATKEYFELKDSLISKGFSNDQASVILSSLDDLGACSYAAKANSIFYKFSNNPSLFESKFGFPMYKEDGTLNSSKLILDMYVHANDISNGGKLFVKNNDNSYSFNVGNKIDIFGREMLNTESQIYMSTYNGSNNYVLNNYLESKNLKWESYNYYSNGAHKIISDYDFELIKQEINNYIDEGKAIQLNIFSSGNEINLISTTNGVHNYSTRTWGEGAGHAVFVTGITQNGYLVSSWGNEYIIPFNDLKNGGEFNIMVDDVK